MKKIVLATGGYDPVHSGHIAYFKAAKSLGDILYIGVNSDEWLAKKKGQPFMTQQERLDIIQNLKMVDYTVKFDDSDGSACNAIKQVKQLHPDDQIIFVNGGDRTIDNIPEMRLLNQPGFENLKFEFGVGGQQKINSSSTILEQWRYPKTIRPWGYYRILQSYDRTVKVKELVVEPGHYLSMQRHRHRQEFWFVSRGCATVYTINRSTDIEIRNRLDIFENTWIGLNEWHQLANEQETPLHIIEIQYGFECVEEDIERQSQ
jgi:D-beta-D-heptose 7-phosphate kinase/D-beta-D-heptose 1-phosphate adenosyltransferase